MGNTVDASLERWREQQMPQVAKKLTLRQLDTVPLHLSRYKIKTFSPRVPYSVMSDEDKTVPRVCCSIDLERCIHGVRHIFSTLDVPTRIYVYGFTERSVVQPSVGLTCEPNRAGEVWIVPHRMANWEIEPMILGEFRLSALAHEGRDFVYQMCFDQDVRLTSNQLLKADTFYQITVSCNWEKETISSSEAKQVTRQAFDTALNEYSVTP